VVAHHHAGTPPQDQVDCQIQSGQNPNPVTMIAFEADIADVARYQSEDKRENVIRASSDGEEPGMPYDRFDRLENDVQEESGDDHDSESRGQKIQEV